MKMFSAKRLAIVSAWLVTMITALGAGAYGHKYRAQIRAVFSSVQKGTAISTNMQMLKVEQMVSPAEGRDGGLAVFNGGLLAADRVGKLWFIDAAKAVQPINVQIPVNVAEFEADPFNKTTILHDLFSVKDIAIQPIDGGIRVLASHNHWHKAERCNTLRVSALETTSEKLLAGGAAAGTWRTIFETTPCRPLEKTPDGGQRAGLGVGGRVEPLPDGAVLLTVGGFDPENELVLQAPQKLDNTYGKTIRIDPVTGKYRPFTIGHRNPQGLAVASSGQIWLTEHAARGGDELNLLVDQKNYGYPLVAYGTQYDAMTWPLSKQQGRHEGFEKPMFVWTPSIGISQLVVLEKSAFPEWRGDVIVASLGGQSLFRVRVEDNRVIFAEPIPIGHRVRDIVEAADGSIVLKTDDSMIIYLSPLNATTAATTSERGAMLAASCQACHAVTADGAARIGPSLWKVAGRPIASASGFNYSAGLQAVEGRWTAETLKRYLADPSAFAPGTTMQLGTKYTEAQINDLITYLQELK